MQLGRKADPLDVAANLLGIGAGLALAACAHRRMGAEGRGMAEPELNLSGREEGWRPLADRMRPATLDEFVGQPHLLGAGQAAAPPARGRAACTR